MKLLFKIILILLLTIVLQQFLPWWVIAVAAFAVTFSMKSSAIQSFTVGFVAIALLWLALAWWIDSTTNSILTSKIAILFKVEKVGILLLATTLVGGIVGGFGGLCGHYCRKVFIISE